jgi:hypothetical protein
MLISGFCCEVIENHALLGYYQASSGNFLLTFWDNLSAPSSGFESKGKPLAPVRSLYRQACGRSKVSVVSANRVVASGWMEGSVVVSVATEKHSVKEEI